MGRYVNTIYLDSCIVIYLVERHPIFAPIIEARLTTAEKMNSVVSPLVRLESLVKPMRNAEKNLLMRYEQFFSAVRLLPMPAEVYEVALSLRVQHNLKTPDALHIATAQYHHCQALWTNDERLASAMRGLAFNIIA